MPETSSPWFAPVSVEALNDLSRNTLMESLGIRYTAAGPDWIEAEMEVGPRTVQPAGLLHGGASAALGESVVSAAAWSTVDPSRFAVVGVEINASHLRSARSGTVRCRARAVRIGTSIQVWQFDVEDAAGRGVSTGRVTVAVLPRPAG